MLLCMCKRHYLYILIYTSIKTGVPQGLVLGPLLFLVYIKLNDFPRSSNIFNFLMYVDDITLYCNLNDIVEGSI